MGHAVTPLQSSFMYFSQKKCIIEHALYLILFYLIRNFFYNATRLLNLGMVCCLFYSLKIIGKLRCNES